MNGAIFEHTSYRGFLKATLAERVSSNRAYSLRAFARALGIPASHLSTVQSGKKNLSLEAAARVAQRLGLSPAESEYFLLLVQIETLAGSGRAGAGSAELVASLRDRARTLKPSSAAARVQDLSVDAFRVIADWYHIPILEMTGLASASAQKLEPKWVARRLGITPVEVEAAVERLVRLELLERDGALYRKTYGHGVFRAQGAHLPLRRFQQTMLVRASRALDEQAPEERYAGFQAFAVSRARLPEARKLIDEFRERLAALFDEDPANARDDVYFLGVQLFNLTADQKEKQK